MKRVAQILAVAAYLWFLTTWLVTPQIWKEEWVRILLYSIVPVLIWESVLRLLPKKKRKKFK